MGVDQCMERRLLVIQDNLGILRWWLLQPLLIDGGYVEDTLELVWGKILFQDIWRMDV